MHIFNTNLTKKIFWFYFKAYGLYIIYVIAFF